MTAGIAAIGAIALGCSLLPAGPTVVTLPGGEGYHERPVVLDDPGGLVRAVEPGSLEYGDPNFGMLAVRAMDEDSAVLSWLGGACDDRARVRVRVSGSSVAIGEQTDEKVGLGCTAVGIPRSVVITFREPIGVRSLTLDPAQ